MHDRNALLADLNPAQREAVTHPGGPLLIVAGAGSGKTRVLTRRAAWLVAGGLPGPALLAITFTNKAAQVLRERLASLPGASGVWAGTFHGFAAWLLRRHGGTIGVDPHFTIADRDDQERVLKALLEEQPPKGLRLRPSAVASWISRRKNGLGELPREWSHAADAMHELARSYHERLRGAGLLDFDDLLIEAQRALAEGEGVADALRARFAHVLVDEYQDTNRVQRDLLMGLLGPARNLTVVGDPDQSIYRWRGATVANILGFAADLPGARTVVLDRNYRSTAHILAAAEGVIARNRGRIEKRLTPDRGSGEPVRVVRASDPRDEAEVVVDAVSRWLAAGGKAGDVGVIYRVNALSRAIELALQARRVPYQVVAGVEFFQRQEVKDVLAYARLVENPRDEAAFARVANVPARGVGATSLARVRAWAASTGRGCLDAAEASAEALPGVPPRARAGLRTLAGIVSAVRAGPRAPVRPLLEDLLERSGYLAALAEEGTDPDGARVDNVRALLEAAEEFDREPPPGDGAGAGGLGAFLERTGLVSDQDGLTEADTVRLLSAHAAKGLEFRLVILVGAEHGYFPHARSMEDTAALEEERRLFYVGLTRAMDRLVVTHAAWRFAAGPLASGQRGAGMEPRLPSPYLRDMPSASVRGEDRFGRMGGRETDRLGEPAARYGQDDAPDLPVFERAAGALGPGDRVRHAVFGVGRLASVSGEGPGRRLAVDFESVGRKLLDPAYARLERIP